MPGSGRTGRSVCRRRGRTRRAQGRRRGCPGRERCNQLGYHVPRAISVRLKKLREARGLTQEALPAKAKTAARVSPDWKRGGMIRTCPVCGRWRARSALGCLNSWTETERPGALLRPMAHEITCSKKLRSTPALPGVPGPAPAPRRRTGDVRGVVAVSAPRRRVVAHRDDGPPRERPHRHPGPGAVHA